MDNANPTNNRQSGSLRGFWSLFITQFQGAFSDNMFKFLAIFFVMEKFSENTNQIDSWIPVIGAVFSVPFIVFSLAGGYLSDRYSKKIVAIGTKVAEVLIMVVATFALMQGNVVFIMAIIFLMSTQSAIFGPAKYGSLPELLPPEKLAWGNGVIGMGTNMAVILGMVAAGFVSSRFGADTAEGYGYSSEAQPLYSWGALAGFVGMQEHGFYAPLNASAAH